MTRVIIANRTLLPEKSSAVANFAKHREEKAREWVALPPTTDKQFTQTRPGLSDAGVGETVGLGVQKFGLPLSRVLASSRTAYGLRTAATPYNPCALPL